MTPCQQLGYKLGDEFKVLKQNRVFEKGDTVKLVLDDGSTAPMFATNPTTKAWLPLKSVKKLIPSNESKQHKIAELQKQIHKLYLQIQSLQLNEIPEGVDVYNPTTWQQGDVIECVDDTRSEWVTEGKLYTCSQSNVDRIVTIEQDDYGHPSTPCALFKFVHRPAKK